MASEPANGGPPTAEYTSGGRAALKWVGLGLGLLVLSGAVLRGWVAAGSERAGLSAALAVPLSLILAASGLYHLIFPRRLAVHLTGVRVRTTWATRFYRWGEVAAVFEADPAVAPDNYRFGFRTADGRTYRFTADRMPGLRAFAGVLRERVSPRVRVEARRALAEGGVVWFGLVGLSRQGFHTRRGGLLPWAEVARVGFDQFGRFEVFRAGRQWPWFSKRAWVVENVDILDELYAARREWADLPG